MKKANAEEEPLLIPNAVRAGLYGGGTGAERVLLTFAARDTSDFTDVPAGAWYSDAVSWAAEMWISPFSSRAIKDRRRKRGIDSKFMTSGGEKR